VALALARRSMVTPDGAVAPTGCDLRHQHAADLAGAILAASPGCRLAVELAYIFRHRRVPRFHTLSLRTSDAVRKGT